MSQCKRRPEGAFAIGGEAQGPQEPGYLHPGWGCAMVSLAR